MAVQEEMQMRQKSFKINERGKPQEYSRLPTSRQTDPPHLHISKLLSY